jgi:ubiquinone/menaquinone biosynthesis C-methylase UbiE
MKLLQTAERVAHNDSSDHVIYQRSLLAYLESAKLVHGKVLEIGTGSGYGLKLIADKADQFVTIDKHKTDFSLPDHEANKIQFVQMNIPPLTGIPDNEFDFVITFQVIEHINKDKAFVDEIRRVLKRGGKLIVTTPNSKMSLTRNPWHVREYTVKQLENLLRNKFESVKTLGVFGNEKVMEYYSKNKESVERITKFDIFKLQYRLPRWLLQMPYDILNRLNRKKLLSQNQHLVSDITHQDHFLSEADDRCFDLFYIATKG